MHRRQNLRVLAHAKIIVRAPDRDLAPLAMMGGGGEIAAVTFQLGEMAVVAIFLEAGELVAQQGLIHDQNSVAVVAMRSSSALTGAMLSGA